MAKPAALGWGGGQGVNLPDPAGAAPWLPWMRRALALAALGEGRTSPNPLVGARLYGRNRGTGNA